MDLVLEAKKLKWALKVGLGEIGAWEGGQSRGLYNDGEGALEQRGKGLDKWLNSYNFINAASVVVVVIAVYLGCCLAIVPKDPSPCVMPHGVR